VFMSFGMNCILHSIDKYYFSSWSINDLTNTYWKEKVLNIYYVT